MTSQTRKQIIAIHILPNIPKGKGNQTMKFGQLVEYNIRNIFFEKLYAKCDGEATTRPFYKKSKLSVSLDQQFQMLFLLYVQVYQNILKPRSWQIDFTWHKPFLKNKGLELVSLSRFLHDILRKIFLTLYSGDSWNYIPHILVSSCTKRIATRMLVIAKLNRKDFYFDRLCLWYQASQLWITCLKLATEAKE